MIKILRWLKAVLISWVIVIATTFGWMPSIDKNIKDAPVESARRLEKTVRTLSEDIGLRDYQILRNLNHAADYIKENLQRSGYTVEEITYTIDHQQFRNIIAFAGPRLPDQAILVGAHYDTCENPGADDNASGIAGLLELAGQLKGRPGVIFAAFTNEEPPFFTTPAMGSYIVARHLKEKHITLKAAVILEMLGYYSDEIFSQRYLPLLGPFYPNQANFVAIVGNFPSHSLVSAMTTGFKQGSSFPVRALVAPSSIPGIYFSDHWSFWQFNYPAVMVSDTAYLRYQHYHKMSDRADNLDYKRMARVVQGLEAAVRHLTRQDP
jgi:Zn-dependent M28 family amino/carboxypeptidase